MVIHLNIHGVCVSVESRSARLLRDLAHDFHYFVIEDLPPGTPTCRIRHVRRGRVPERWRRVARMGRSTLYRPWKGWARIGFFGTSWVSYSYGRRRAIVRARDAAAAYETVYLVLLSYCGERLDRDGLHRVHGLGIATAGGSAMLVLAPSGGGKSSIAMEWLRAKDARFLSDDVPLVDSACELRAFPQRIAMRARPARVPKKYVRRFRRARYGEKWVVGAEWFAPRVTDRAPLAWVALMEKSDAPTSRVEEISPVHLAWPLIKWLVMGLETPQVWELFLRPSPRDIVRKAGVLASRARVAWRIARSCRAARIRLSSRPGESAEVLLSFLRGLD